MTASCSIRRAQKRENIRELEVNEKHASFERVERVEHALQARCISCRD